MTQNKQRSVLYLILVCLIPLVVYLHAGVARGLKKMSDTSGSAGFVPSAQAVRLVALGYDQLLADFYWLAFVNYVGDDVGRVQDHYSSADKYLDLITGLDPHFLQSYWFCAFTVGADQKRPFRADEIIRRGINSNPDNWYLYYIAGINMYLYAHDEEAAARYYSRGATLPYAPTILSRQAKILASKIPSRLKELNTWTSIYESESSRLIRAKAREKLLRLWAQIYYASPKGVLRSKAERELHRLHQ